MCVSTAPGVCVPLLSVCVCVHCSRCVWVCVHCSRCVCVCVVCVCVGRTHSDSERGHKATEVKCRPTGLKSFLKLNVNFI